MKSFLSYYGGKSLLADKIIARFPKHTCYVEVFAGAAWLLFKKKESKVEIINDINADLITLYRVVKHHRDEFLRCLRWLPVSREEFERFKRDNPETLTDIQRAVRFFYLLKNGYASRIPNPSFSISTDRGSNFDLLRIEEELRAVHERLSRVYIENLPYEKIIRRFDKPHTLFYIDPPYYGHEKDYGNGIFKRDDFAKLETLLQNIEGKFIMSINNVKEVRRLFKDFYIEEIKTTYTCSGTSNKKATELLIMNLRNKHSHLHIS